ncbi:MAG: ORF6N domain-containing protein [Candidatus Gastranaerophilales bacterium]|nr:ORF6N domain-containing protein [Candidatus Gastranaerophilales bacterium]
MNELVPIEIIENKIFVIRGQKVMLDSDLAQLYDVETKRLNEAVRRNLGRFPERFMFQLTDGEWERLKYQIGTSSYGNKNNSNLRSQFATANKNISKMRYNPYVFTEHGTLMLSSVLNSQRAINVSIQIIEVFDKLKQFALTQNQLTERISSLEEAFMNYAKDNNEDIEELRKAVNLLLDIHKPAKIGFTS